MAIASDNTGSTSTLTAAEIAAQVAAASEQAAQTTMYPNLPSPSGNVIPDQVANGTTGYVGSQLGTGNTPTTATTANGASVFNTINVNTNVAQLTDAEKKIIAANEAAAKAAADAAAATKAASDLAAAESAANRVDAFKLLQNTFEAYGLGDLSATIGEFIKQNIGPNEAALRLKTDTTIDPATGKPYNAAYVARFAGNQARVANGLNALSEATYIDLENQYSNLMSSYGVNNLANKDQFAQLIGKDVSAPELNQRLDLAVTQVQQADPTVMATLEQFYPSITANHLVSYFLSPEETLPMLQRQVQTADIGAAATQQGLTTDEASAAKLAAYGVSYDQAKAGYSKIAEILPTASKLSQIYSGQTAGYNQTTGESQYLMNNADAALTQRKINMLEEAQFAGRSGIDRQANPLQKNLQGSF